MNIESLREYCISKNDVEETMPFGPDVIVYKTGGKAFLFCRLDTSPLQFNVKCDPELALQLREEYNCVLPGYHMNKKHWNTIISDGSVSDKVLKQWIDNSYNHVLPKQKKKK